MTEKKVLSITYDPRPELLRAKYELKEGAFSAQFSLMHLMSKDELIEVPTAYGGAKRVEHGPLKVYGFYEGLLEVNPANPEQNFIRLWKRGEEEKKWEYPVRINEGELSIISELPTKIENEEQVAITVAGKMLEKLAPQWQQCQSNPQEQWPIAKRPRPDSQIGRSV